jgi:pyruvate formate lyase activating enzyme
VRPEDLCKELLKDRAYFGEDGGVTLSGGEALLQSESVELLRLLKEAGVGTAVDTCGQIPTATLSAALDYADIVLYDVKIADSETHKKFTGTGNELILKNLITVANWAGAGESGTVSGGVCSHGVRREQPSPVDEEANSELSVTGRPPENRPVVPGSGAHGRLWIRTPIIPGATDSVSNIAAIARILASLPDAARALERWELSAFNNLCTSKYESMGEVWQYKDAPLKTMEEMAELLKAAQNELPGADIRTTGMTAKQ